MRYLAEELEKRGHIALAPTLPTTFQDVGTCGELLFRYLADNLADERIVHFVGHSMGGLVIRHLLSRHIVEGLGRVVLAGTPNMGSRYSNRLLLFSPLKRIFRGLPDLAEPGLAVGPPLNVPAPEIGIVVGTRPDPIRRWFLHGENDGLVTTESALRVNAGDVIRVSCCHEWLHWRSDTADAIDVFLRTGKFKKDS